MKKKLFVLMSLLFVIFPCITILTGCKRTDRQVTVIQIENAFMAEVGSVFDGWTINSVIPLWDSSIKNYSQAEKTYLERQNIDSSDFRAAGEIELTISNDTYYRLNHSLIWLKFSNKKSASVCVDKYFRKNFEVKGYGNIVVVAHTEIADFVFDFIDDVVAGKKTGVKA